MIKLVSFLVAASLCIGIAYALDGLRGLQGSVAGVGIALVMCGVSFFLLRWARRARGQAIVAAMMGSVLASFVIIAVSLVLLGLLWPDLLRAGALTTIAVYFAFRVAEGVGPRAHGMQAGIESTSGGPR